MDIDGSGEVQRHISGAEFDEPKPGYFIGNLDDPTFQITRGYFVGHFMREHGLSILARDDVECAVMYLPEHNSSPPHYHPQGFEITYCISGRLHLIIDGENVELTENQFMVIPPDVVLQNPENDPGTRIFVVKAPSVPGDKFDA